VSRFDRGKPESDDTPDRRVANLAARQWGVLSVDELRACGLSDDSIMRRARAGHLQVIHPGVYGVGHAPLTMRARFLAAVKAAGEGAALSHRAAAALWRLIDWDDRWLPEVTVSTRHTRTIPGVIVHRTRVPFEVVSLDGIPVTIPARVIVDLSSVLSFDALRRVAREALAQNKVALKDITAVRGRKGGKNLTRILADGYTPTRSELEDAVLDLIERGGLVKPLVNVRKHGRVPDFRWPEQHLVVEADGKAWHDHKLAREDDVERQAELEAQGLRVLRVTWRQVIAQPVQTLERLRAAGAPGARLRSTPRP
jgi:hypothetical protein